MKLFTKSIFKKLEKTPLYSTDDNKNAKAICKIFNPYGAGTWYVFEGEQQADGDWLLYGIADIQVKEFGYFSLKELESTRVRIFGESFPLERDRYYTPQTKDEIMNS